MSDETNASAPVSDAEAVDTPTPHEPHIKILRGRPTDAEVAALIAVLGSSGGAPAQLPTESTRWGLPVDKLRFSMSNYQRLTMQQIAHMKH
jgi:Acyl-CoA carboxylase epsilon subunit